MTIAIYAGSFDPVTRGHVDLIERASKVFTKLIVGVGVNENKKGLFSYQERVNLLQNVCTQPNVQVLEFRGLLVDFCNKMDATVIIRGLRAVTDFESELGMAHVNTQLSSNIDTFFLPTKPEYSFVSSSTVKALAAFGSDVSYYVHPIVVEALRQKNGFMIGV